MRRILLVIAATLAGALPAVVLAPPAHACSCVGRTQPAVEFDGEALDNSFNQTAGLVWRFRVVSGRGVRPGDVVSVHLDVEHQLADGPIMSTSCGLGKAPTPGDVYRVGAVAADVNGERRLFANLCGGYFEAVAGTNTHGPANESRPPPVLFAIAAVTLIAAVVSTVRAARPS